MVVTDHRDLVLTLHAANLNCFSERKYFVEILLPVLPRGSACPYDDCSMHETTDIVDEQRSYRIVRFPEAILETGQSRSTIYTLMNKGKFPLSHRLNASCTSIGWYEYEIYPFKKSTRAIPPTSPANGENASSMNTVNAVMLPQATNGEKTKRLVGPETKTKLRSGGAALVITAIKVNGHEGEIYLQRGTGKLFGAIGEVPPEILSLYFAG
jgi:predicted DNA-binding transcriptional regulator AlpA